MGIFAPLNFKALPVKLKISKKTIVRLTVLAVLAGAAYFFDYYFENNPEKVAQLETSHSAESKTQGNFIFYELTRSLNAKQNLHKFPIRFIQSRIHDKFLQKYHQLRNYHVLKAESIKQKVPLVFLIHFVVFRDDHSTLPDDEPFFC